VRIPLLLACLAPLAAVAANPGYVRVPAGEFATVLAYEDAKGPQRIAAFEMMTRPVSNEDFRAFVRSHPQWRRDRVSPLLAGRGYLKQWRSDDKPAADTQGGQPVTNVSWFAASAYCSAQGARLPSWIQWEYAAAADEKRRDARSDPAWRERILAWYAEPATRPLPASGAGVPNAYGLRDLHGVVWEWTDDHASLLVSADNREQGDPDKARFCGAGALSVADREQYAVLMRVALLSSLEAADSTSRLGFRCVKDVR
jgi:formylglycine-generating enzyme required for sulfatase activity